MLRITFETTPGTSLARVHDAAGSAATTIDSVLQTDRTEWLAFLTVSDLEDAPADRLDGLADVDLVYSESYAAASGTFLLLLRFRGDPCIARLLAERRAIPHAIQVGEHRLESTVTVEDWEHLQTVADEIEAERDAFELVSVNQVDRVDAMLGNDSLKRTVMGSLSTEHLRTLEAAYRTGYFDVPQRASAGDVAAELDISQSTFSKRLRRAATALLGLVFGSGAATGTDGQ